MSSKSIYETELHKKTLGKTDLPDILAVSIGQSI